MTRSKDILKELEDISPVVAQLNPIVPYQVPEVYFDTLSSVIMARIATGGHEENSLLLVAGKQMPQEVPAGFFENLAGNILSRINTQQKQSVIDELNELSPVLAGISKTNVYEVPVGYFDGVVATVTTQTKATANVVSMFNRKVWMRYAAAAVVFTMIAFGLNLFTKQATVVSNDPVVKNESVVPGNIKTVEQFNRELASISEDEIINYLKLTADSKDAETIAGYVDHSKLPEEADYMDEEFLNSLMKELEQTNTETKTN